MKTLKSFLIAVTCFMLSTVVSHATITQTRVNCTIELTEHPTFGTPPYTYFWLPNGETNQTIVVTINGPYGVNITDSLGQSQTEAIQVTLVTGWISNVNTTITRPTCPQTADGIIAVTSVGGSSGPLYQFTWSNGYQNTGQTSVANGLVAGTYSVTVQDIAICVSYVKTITITPLTFSLNLTSGLWNCAQDSANLTVQTVVPSGTQALFQYEWSTGVLTASPQLLVHDTGNYIVTVTDIFSACRQSDTLHLGPDDFKIDKLVADPIGCRTSTQGGVVFEVSGGLFINNECYLLTVINAVQDTLTNKIVMPYGIEGFYVAGIYSVVLTDGRGCIRNRSITIDTFLTAASKIKDVDCYGGQDGVAAATAQGGNGTYNFHWSNGSTLASPVNLSAGINTVTVTDRESNCNQIKTVTIVQPGKLTLYFYPSVPHISCVSADDGWVHAEIYGGTPPYTYLWSNGETDDTLGTTITSVPEGRYKITVTDSKGCQINDSVYIHGALGILTIDTIKTVSAYCNNTNGSIRVTALGGSGSLSYLMYRNSVTNGNLVYSGSSSLKEYLAGGSYIVQVRDGYGCMVADTVSVTTQSKFQVVVTVTPATCYQNDGKVSLHVIGGNPPFRYYWGYYGQAFYGDSIRGGLGLGYTTVEVQDTARACYQRVDPVITRLPNPTVTLTGTDGKCYEEPDASLTAQVTGGTPPYSYTWSGYGEIDTVTGSVADHLYGKALGANPELYPYLDYTLVVTDSNNCKTTMAKRIFQMTRSALNLTISQDGSKLIAWAHGSGGGFYHYRWSTGDSTETIIITTTGEYICTVTDQYGCAKWKSTTGEGGNATGIDEPDGFFWKAYPNPFSHQLMVEFETSVERQIQLYNSMGQLVFKEKSEQKILSIDCSEISLGTYILVVQENGKISSKKFVKME